MIIEGGRISSLKNSTPLTKRPGQLRTLAARPHPQQKGSRPCYTHLYLPCNSTPGNFTEKTAPDWRRNLPDTTPENGPTF